MEKARIAPKSLLAAVLIAPLVAATLVACGGSDDNSGSGDGKMVGGMVACDSKSIDDGVQAWAKAYGNGQQASLPNDPGTYKCADGWAVAFPNVGPEKTAVTVTVVLEAEGQFWIPKDRGKVCGNTAADSDVPKQLFQQACQTN